MRGSSCADGKRKLPIAYGFLDYDSDSIEAWSHLFPNAWDSAPGGCVARSAKFGIIFVCPRCCAARDEWLKQNEQTQNDKTSKKSPERTTGSDERQGECEVVLALPVIFARMESLQEWNARMEFQLDEPGTIAFKLSIPS